jgi:hypothetical protein
MPSEATKKARMWEMKCCSVFESLFQSAVFLDRSISLAVQKDALAFFLHPPYVGMLNGEENYAMRVCVEEWFWSKVAFGLGNLVF